MTGTDPALARAHEDYVATINANDAVYLPPNEPAVAGKAAIRPWLRVWGTTEPERTLRPGRRRVGPS